MSIPNGMSVQADVYEEIDRLKGISTRSQAHHGAQEIRPDLGRIDTPRQRVSLHGAHQHI